MKIVKFVFLGLFGLIFVFSLAFTLELGGLRWKMFFNPKHEAVRRKVFKETRSYNEAKLQDLIRYRLQYLRTESKEEKEILASSIRHMFSEYDERKLPLELKNFLAEIKYGR